MEKDTANILEDFLLRADRLYRDLKKLRSDEIDVRHFCILEEGPIKNPPFRTVKREELEEFIHNLELLKRASIKHINIYVFGFLDMVEENTFKPYNDYMTMRVLAKKYKEALK